MTATGPKECPNAGGDAAQVGNRQQGLEAARPTRPPGQDRRGEGDALASSFRGGISTIADLGPPDRHRADPGLDRPLRPMAMPDEAGTATGQTLLPHRGQERLGFRLDGLGQQPAGAFAQHGRQRIVDLVGVSKRMNGGIVLHGVSLLREVLAGWTPATIRRPLKPSSPSSPHSSVLCRHGLNRRKRPVSLL